MYTFKKAGATWFLDDRSLERVIEQLDHEPKERRGHYVREHANGKVFIKFFQEKGFSGLIRNRILPRGKKEYDLSKRLRALSVLTPKALGYGIAPRGSYVIQEWIEGEPLIDWKDDRSRRQQLIPGLVALLGELKSKGIRHNDLHLGNIIAASGDTNLNSRGRPSLRPGTPGGSEEPHPHAGTRAYLGVRRGERQSDNEGIRVKANWYKFYLVDLHKSTIKRSFTFADDISNVSHALAMVYDGMDEQERAWFFNQYGGDILRSAVEKELARLRARWIARKAARAFRTTSVLVASRGRVSVRGTEEKAHGEWLAAIEKDRKVSVDRHADHLRKIYAHTRRLRRAWKNHVILEYMRLFIVPRPYYLQHASGSQPGYIAMEDLTGKGEELDRFLDRNYDGMSRTAWYDFVDAFSLFLVSTLNKRIIHADLKACNIFVLQKGTFLFLDVEDLDFLGLDDAALKRMLIQLNSTVPGRISIRDRLRLFAKITRSFSSDRKRLLREIASESLQREIVYEGVKGLKRESWG